MTDSLRQTLRDAGLKRTEARVAVLGAIQQLGVPVTHADLLKHAHVAELDEITVYRTLATLVEADLVHRVFGTDGAWRYCAQPADRSGCPGNHAHFLCLDCGRMSCLVDQVMPRVEVPDGTRVTGRSLVAFGQCADCART